jgi:hypothetical protein
MRSVALILALLGTLAASARAQDAQKPAALPPEQASMYGYGDSNKTCAAWTDVCMTCRRAENGDPVCPNVGIACQPQPIRCIRQVGEADPNQPKPEAPKSEPPSKAEPSK